MHVASKITWDARVAFLLNLQVWKGDIVTVTADAIINPCGSNADFAGQVGHALAATGGEALVNETRRATQGLNMREGDAVLGPSTGLHAKNLIHVHGPGWSGNAAQSIGELGRTIENILKLADLHKLSSIALPSVSSGGCVLT